MNFTLFYPIYPRIINQPWGVLDPATYSQFGFTRHNGEDDAIGKDSLVRAPFAGQTVKNGFQPNGGGIYCGFISQVQYDFPDFDCVTPDGVSVHFPAAKCYVLLDFLHLKSISATEGKKYNTGDVLAVQDNTGFSTGPHTHIQARRVAWDGKTFTDIDTNDAHNSFDLTQFYTGGYAKDMQTISLLQKVVVLLKKLLGQ